MLKPFSLYKFNHEAILNLNKNRSRSMVWVSDDFVKKTKVYGDQVGTITNVFQDCHNGILKMPDGKVFHVKSNFVIFVD
jgi:hypothetical protein